MVGTENILLYCRKSQIYSGINLTIVLSRRLQRDAHGMGIFLYALWIFVLKSTV